ncbi:MAG: adenylate kinase [Halobacteriales archaeon]
MSEPAILLLGPPGAGKGTQSARLAETYDLEHITTGDALRERKDMATPHGTPREYMEAGELVPDPVVNEIVRDAIESADGFVLDGYPRNLSQAEYLDEIADLDVVIHLEVGRDELERRLTGRRVCSECGANYHVEYAPPEVEGVCDECGGELVQRDDDQPETVRERLRVYEETTEPVVNRYRERHPDFHGIDGERSPDAVADAVTSLLAEIVTG